MTINSPEITTIPTGPPPAPDHSMPSIVYIGGFTKWWDTENYIARALLRAGCAVYCCEERDHNPAKALAFIAQHKPDVVLFAKCKLSKDWTSARHEISGWIADWRRHCKLVCCWVFDLMHPNFDPARWHWARVVAPLCDFFFTTDGYSVRWLARRGPAVLLRQGIGDDVRPGERKAEFECDVAFIGIVYGGRSNELWRISEHFGPRYKRFGKVRGLALNDLCASAKVIYGPAYPEPSRYPGYFSNRIFVATGYGGCYYAPWVRGMQKEGWQAGVHFAARHEHDPPESIIADLEGLIADDNRRERLRQAGQAHCVGNFTYDHRVATLLEHLKTKL